MVLSLDDREGRVLVSKSPIRLPALSALSALSDLCPGVASSRARVSVPAVAQRMEEAYILHTSMETSLLRINQRQPVFHGLSTDVRQRAGIPRWGLPLRSLLGHTRMFPNQSVNRHLAGHTIQTLLSVVAQSL